MKRFLLPAFAAAFIFTACDKPDILKTAAEKATPIPVPAATPKPNPTPKKGDWMFKDGRTLLDQKPKK